MKLKQTSSHSKKRIVIITIAALLLIGASAAAVVHYTSIDIPGLSDNDPESTQPITTPTNPGDGDATNNDDPSDDNAEPTPLPEPKTDTDDQQPASNDIDIAITSTDIQSSSLRVRTLIETAVDGTCDLRLERDNTVVLESSAGTQPLASSSTCQGFDVPTDGLSGTHTLVITVTAGDRSGSVSQEVTL